MKFQPQARRTGAVCPQSLLCLVLLTAAPWIAVSNLEGDALHALRQALSDPSEALISWDPSATTPCTWDYVTCNPNDSVIRLDLGNSSLSGSLVPELGNLSNLQYLEMYGNNISGAIPAIFGNLTHLISLDLYRNALSGSIPASLGNLASLRFLRLNNNNLSGSIPESLTSLDDLQVLDLSFNQLSGPIPVSLARLFTPISFQGNLSLYYPGTPTGAPAPAPIA